MDFAEGTNLGNETDVESINTVFDAAPKGGVTCVK